MKGFSLLKRHAVFAVCSLLGIITLIPYWQVRNYQFVYYDDNVYVTANPNVQAGLTAKSIAWSFSMTGYASNWHPLTWMSHMIDVEMFGMNPGRHHLTNLFLHIANTLLLFLFLQAMTTAIWKSGFVAALFALHPMHVESVAWISERKDVLSALFWFLTLGCYLWYARRRGFARYALVVFTFGLGLLAKPMLVTLPCVLLLLDFWPLRRIDLPWLEEKKQGRMPGTVDRNPKASAQIGSQIAPSSLKFLLLEKLPLFLFSAASCLVTIIAQKKGGALELLETLPFAVRLANGITSYGLYLWKMVAPYHLACLYPHSYQIVWPGVILSLLFLGIATGLSLKTMRHMPYMAVGWLWYLGTLVPVIGFVQVGFQAMADRYTYIPLIGIFIMIAWGVPEALQGLPHRTDILSAAAAVLILFMMIITRAQVAYWTDSIPLFEHALAVMGINNLGHALIEQGRLDEAMSQFLEALRIKPDDVDAHCNLGFVYAKQRRTDKAIRQFREALRIKPDYTPAQQNLAYALRKAGLSK